MDKIDLIQRIENYLAAGGLNNPELMDHERVRDLIIDCRDALAHPNPAAQHWHDLYLAKCKDLQDRQAMLGAEIAALEEELEELKENQPKQAFKLSDAGADTNIVRGLQPKGEGMVALHQPVAWHHPECAGECIACLIENVVKEAYGTQGLEYLHRHLQQIETKGL